MLASVALTVFSALTVLRRLLEPACPSCAAKRWIDHPGQLACRRCGWTSASGKASEPPAQYELLPQFLGR